MENLNSLENSTEQNKHSLFEKIKESRKFFLLGLAALALEQGVENFDSDKFREAVDIGMAASSTIINAPIEAINDDLYREFGVEEEASGEMYEVKIEPNTVSLQQIAYRDMEKEFALDTAKESLTYLGTVFTSLKARHLARLNKFDIGESGILKKIPQNYFYNDDYYKENLRKPKTGGGTWRRSAFIQNK